MLSKNLFLTGLLGASLFAGIHANAQLSQGGIPLRLQTDATILNSVKNAELPNWAAFQQKRQIDGLNSTDIVGLFTNVDIQFPQSGQFTKLADGRTIWSASLKIAGAPAIGLYFNNFQFPKGVKMYVSNSNDQQILGAFDANNNSDDNLFAIDAVQGEIVKIELDIDQNVNIDDIKMNIDRAAVIFKSYQHLNAFADVQPWDAYDNFLNGSSSVCHINAICPEGTKWDIQRRATAQVLVPVGQYLSVCSGTMVNNTGNTSANCTPYYLTATHCEGTGSTTNSTFGQWIFRFNFEHKNCAGTDNPTSNSLTGANFVARANYNESWDVQEINGDFLLLKLKNNIPASYNVTLAGWKNTVPTTLNYSGDNRFIGFHHPDGDNKKLSRSRQIYSTSMGANGSHWQTLLTEGYGSTGSSGSGLFDNDGYLIGQLSAGGDYQLPASCVLNAAGEQTGTGDLVLYSKFSKDWDYSADGTAANRKLKPWLDPANSGATFINPVNSNCTAITTGISDIDSDLDAAISVYPNPTTSNSVNIKANLKEATNLRVSVLSITGQELMVKTVTNVQYFNQTLDITNLSNGMYIIKIENGTGFATKKLMVTK